MLKNSWKSISIWSAGLTVIYMIAALIVNPHFFTGFYVVVKTIFVMFISSFFILTIILMIVNLFKEYRVADKRGKRIMLVLAVIALIYLIPKLIADFR